jgi:uncharacterized membrane protein YuzA (DUF378 family)
MNTCGSKKCCGAFWYSLANILLIIGGINWGLIGLGMFLNIDLNLVNIVFGSLPAIEAIVYILVGISAIVKMFDCRCKKEMCCNEEGCKTCKEETTISQ